MKDKGTERFNKRAPLSAAERDVGAASASRQSWVEKEPGGELDLPLCAFNYTRLAGLQSLESGGEARAGRITDTSEGTTGLRRVYGERLSITPQRF